jgi:hypothetical protein
MQRKNFKDPVTGEEFSISEYTTSFKAGDRVYKDKYRKELINPKTGNKLVLIPRNKEEIGMPTILGFSSSSEAGREKIRNHFQKRATNFDTKGAGRDEKDQKSSDFKQQILERAKDGKM